MTNIYFETTGCSHNFADSEQMAGLLKEAQFKIVDNIEDADVVVFNTCTVKGPTESAFFRRLEEVKEKYPYKMVIVAGCIAQTEPQKLKKYPLVGTKQIHKIVEVVEETLNDNIIKMLETGEMPPLNLPRVRKNSIVEIIPISRGCLGACTFCKTKAARGNLVSYPLIEIVDEAKKALKEGVKEIWLTSQDTGCYGFDIDTNLVALLKELVNIPGEFKIRLGMMNPNNLLKFKDEFYEIFSHPKIFKFVHLPLQSGNDDILKEMNRFYTVKEFKTLVQELRIKFPEITLATDMIVGFPGETDEQFWDSQSVIRELSPEVVNISRFWPRPKTPAEKMQPLPGDVVKHRSRVLADICKNISRLQNEKWLDQETEIIIDEKGKTGQEWLGRNPSYKPILVHGEFKLGDVFKIKIIKLTDYSLLGEKV